LALIGTGRGLLTPPTCSRLAPHRRLDLIAKEDPAAAELVAGKQFAPGVFEHGRDRQMQQLGDVAAVEDVFARQPRMGGNGCVDRAHLTLAEEWPLG
jgi:hypothetical protein